LFLTVAVLECIKKQRNTFGNNPRVTLLLRLYLPDGLELVKKAERQIHKAHAKKVG